MKPYVKSSTVRFKNPTHRRDRPDITEIADETIRQSGSLAQYCAAFYQKVPFFLSKTSVALSAENFRSVIH